MSDFNTIPQMGFSFSQLGRKPQRTSCTMRYASALFLLLVVSILLISSPREAQCKNSFFQLRGNGSLGFAHHPNNRVQDGVSNSGVEMGGGGEVSLYNIFSSGGLRVSFLVWDIVLSGVANVFNTGVTVQYENKFDLLGREFYYGCGFGYEYVVAPTKDAASTWSGYNLKVDVRTNTGVVVSGLYLKFQQIIMGDVKDPLFITAGIEILYELWGDTPQKTAHKENFVKKYNNPIIVDSTDNDGDGVPNLKDLCPSTFKGRQVEDNGCRPIADGMKFDNLKFSKGKSSLINDGSGEIKRLSELLKANETIHIVIVVEAENAGLARKRADLIEMKLKRAGIKSERIKTSPTVGIKSQLSFNFRLGI